MKLKNMVECIEHSSHRDLTIGTTYEVYRTLFDQDSHVVYYELANVKGLVPTAWFKSALKYYTSERDRMIKCNEDCTNEIEYRYKCIRTNTEYLAMLKDKITELEPIAPAVLTPAVLTPADMSDL